MKGKVGQQTRPGVIVPGLSGLKSVSLSKQAKLRLKWMDYNHRHSNIALTCRHFGIGRSLFYKWKVRYEQQGLTGLENCSQRPRSIRQPMTPNTVVSLVKRLRTANPEFSKYKLAVILKRDHGYHLSPSTIGRIITRHNLFFSAPIKPKQHPGRRKSAYRHRKPKELSVVKPGDLVEFDVKHLPNLGAKRYAFTAVDVVSKQASIHVASTISSRQATIAWDKVTTQLGTPNNLVTDNGSENMGAFEQLLDTQSTNHYWARVRTPKDKPVVERFIGTLERECIQWGGVAIDLVDQQQIIDSWLNKYHNYRPHQSLNYLTPNEYQARLETEVSTM